MLKEEDLFRQAMMTAHDYMVNAKSEIDESFGDGYAAEHPELVAAYMQAAGYDLRTMLEHQGRLRKIDADNARD